MDMSLHIHRPTALAASSPNTHISSPKRKRNTDDPLDIAFAPPPTRLRTADLPTRAAFPQDDDNGNDQVAGDRSPRAAVAGRFQSLNLNGYDFDFTTTMKDPSPPPSTIADSQDFQASSQASTQSSEPQPVTPDATTTGNITLGSFTYPAKLPLEIPETPRLKPTSVSSSVISPIPRSKSPPPLALWWADAEITGHNPSDPADDGYGINGVGFLPTPALASARAERRKRQVAEWKAREAREARQKRSEARRRRDFEMSSGGVGASDGALSGGQQRRVRSGYVMAASFGSVECLLPPTYKRMISAWLEEDCPNFDYGGFVVGDVVKEARLLGKSEGMLAGVPFFNEVFRQLDCTVEWHIHEGENFTPVKHCATVRGSIRKILLGERVALNTLARCSGIATKTSSLLSLLHSHSSKPPILAGTRKTTPGFRLPEKYAMLIGGADPHRHDLSSMTMLKDNHIWACASSSSSSSSTTTTSSSRSTDSAITTAVRTAKAAGGFAVKVEVECQSEAEAIEAIRAGADVVMLDNFPSEELKKTARDLKWRFSLGEEEFERDEEEREGRQDNRELKREFLIEVSGGLTEENIGEYVCEWVDVISTSSIHQGVKHVDFSLKVVH
ncbi:MAG: hypothetical protein Q9218_004869 [Villophora microphyllina]